ncbi:hypothetical protein O9A_00873, partial [Bartonella koehlerae C-29]
KSPVNTYFKYIIWYFYYKLIIQRYLYTILNKLSPIHANLLCKSCSSISYQAFGNRQTISNCTRGLSLSLPILCHWKMRELFTCIGEVDTIGGLLTGTIAKTVLNVLFAIIYLAVLFSTRPKLTFIILIILPLQIGSLALVYPVLRQQLCRAFTLQATH